MKRNFFKKKKKKNLQNLSFTIIFVCFLNSGDYVRIRPSHILTHDNTSAVLDKFEQLGSPPMFDRRQPVFALDHNVQDKSSANLAKYARIEQFAQRAGVAFFPAGRGIGHQVMCEEGYAWPGTVAVASDSHSNMYGGLGCLGTPVVRTDAAAVWAIGEFWWQVPPVSKIRLEGALPRGVSGKDVIVALCAAFNDDQVLNHAVEFELCDGAQLSVDERLTIANMTTEFGCAAGVFYPDQHVVEWLRAARAGSNERLADLERELPALRPDDNAQYASVLRLALPSLTPHVAGPNGVKIAKPLVEFQQNKGKRCEEIFLKNFSPSGCSKSLFIVVRKRTSVRHSSCCPGVCWRQTGASQRRVLCCGSVESRARVGRRRISSADQCGRKTTASRLRTMHWIGRR